MELTDSRLEIQLWRLEKGSCQLRLPSPVSMKLSVSPAHCTSTAKSHPWRIGAGIGARRCQTGRPHADFGCCTRRSLVRVQRRGDQAFAEPRFAASYRLNRENSCC